MEPAFILELKLSPKANDQLRLSDPPYDDDDDVDPNLTVDG
jgi:hypothetical protein